MSRVPSRVSLLLLLFTMSLSGACGSPDTSPTVAVPAVGLDRVLVPLGGPLEMSYQFTASSDITDLTEPYRVFVHFLDANGELMFTDDHDPPVATTEWNPGETVTYTRVMPIPNYPYVGKASIALGLYSPVTGDRVALEGAHIGQATYEVATIELAPPRENNPPMFQDGWHSPEFGGDREWRWTTGEAVIAFRNPRLDSTLYVELDGPTQLSESPQRVDLVIGDRTIDSFVLETTGVTTHTTLVNADDLGDGDTTTLTLHVDQTIVPAELPGSDLVDDRQLGVRVFCACLESPRVFCECPDRP